MAKLIYICLALIAAQVVLVQGHGYVQVLYGADLLPARKINSNRFLLY
jgi:hypothetical protein